MYKPNFQKREVIVFRQFQRKGYSLFACLGREVVISVLSASTLLSAKAANISDEMWRVDSTGHVKEYWLDDVDVTGSRAPLTKSQAARMVTVLSREDIAQAPVQSVNDLLKYAVGVDVRQRGALGSQTDISIRGGTQEQITILLNGINICDPQTGHNALDLPLQLSEIVRIEVLEGPAGRIFGTSSLVGAINIVTRPDGASGVDVTAEGGSFGYASVGARANMKSGCWNNQVSAGYRRSDGFSRCTKGSLNTDYSGSKAFWQGEYDDADLRLSWHLGLADKGWGSGTFYATPQWQADDQYEHTTKVFSAIQAETKRGTVHFRPSLYWNQNRDRYEGWRGQPDKMRYNYNRCDVLGLSLNSFFDSPLGRTAFGGEIRNEDLVSGNLGEPLFRTHHISGTDRDYTLGVNRTNISAHLEHNVMVKGFTLSAGFVAAKSTWSSMNIKLYPGVDLSYTIPLGLRHQAPASLKLFAGWNTSLRLPSFTEMYYKLKSYAADPHLKPEEMQAAEVGALLSTPAMRLKTVVFHHHGRNMIDWVMDTSLGDEAKWESVNHIKLNATGVEAELTADIGRLLALHMPPTVLGLSYGYMTQDKDLEKQMVSQYAMEYLRHKLVASLQTRLFNALDLRFGMRWQDRVGSYTTFSGEVCDYRPYALADLRLTWTHRQTKIYAEVNNLFDNRDYTDFGNVPQPGAWFVVGAQFAYKFK